MKTYLVAILPLLAFACAGGPKAARDAQAVAVSSPAEAPPPAAVAQQAPPKPADKTAQQLSVEKQDRVDTKKRASDAQETLADNAPVKIGFGGIVITLADNLLFAEDEASLLASSQPLMAKIAGALLVTKERDLIVEGHTDSSGDQNRSIELSRQRAEAVRNYLIAQGYPASRIRAQGIGQDRPVGTNSSVKGRAGNRRVEIVVSFKEDESL
jgi:outer membrane protein OmpA-like peptidoglycan-associated protein